MAKIYKHVTIIKTASIRNKTAQNICLIGKTRQPVLSLTKDKVIYLVYKSSMKNVPVTYFPAAKPLNCFSCIYLYINIFYFHLNVKVIPC